mgnify:FL=1
MSGLYLKCGRWFVKSHGHPGQNSYIEVGNLLLSFGKFFISLQEEELHMDQFNTNEVLGGE